jgi:hypothetical protein
MMVVMVAGGEQRFELLGVALGTQNVRRNLTDVRECGGAIELIKLGKLSNSLY